MHNPSISILGPGPDVMLIEGFDCSPVETDKTGAYYREPVRAGFWVEILVYVVAPSWAVCSPFQRGRADNTAKFTRYWFSRYPRILGTDCGAL